MSDDEEHDDSEIEAFSTFESMNLKDDLLKGIYSFGFESPSVVQAKGIMQIIAGRDVICQAQSGTGKTATFSISLLQFVEISVRECQGLILSPSRELAIQSQQVIQELGKYMNVQSHACIGGKSVGDDIKKLNFGQHVISGTPGRVLDMIRKGHLRLKQTKVMILDEADELMDRGFREQIQSIYQYLPRSIQIVVVSATMPKDVVDLTSKFLADPIKILVKRDELTLDGIKQYFISVDEEEWKFDTLCDLYGTLTVSQSVIFCNYRSKVDWLIKKLTDENFSASAVHGDMHQKQRDLVMQEFRQGKARVLIATDIWSRGIDVQQVSLVVNYDLPVNRESYIHRIGRSGRFGRKGIAVNLVTVDDMNTLRDIEQFYSTQISEMPALNTL